MYIARIKIKKKETYLDTFYEKNKWMECFKHKDKICKWRINKDNTIEFIIGTYNDRFEALKDGKMLYFNILYELHRNEYGFYLGDNNYVTQMYHENRGYTIEEFNKNEEWFFCSKKYRANLLGLFVFEIDEDIDDYDKYYKSFKGEIITINDKAFKFIERISKLDEKYLYSESNQIIFNLIRISENVDEKTQILLLCQALEMMGISKEKSNKEKRLIDKLKKIVKKSKLSKQKINSLNGYLENGKKISSREKCENLMSKYCKYEYDGFDKTKIFKKAYEIRSKIIHGEKVNEEGIYLIGIQLKAIVLDILKEWSKDNT